MGRSLGNNFVVRTVIGIHCTDGVIMGVEKLLLSRMLVPGTNRRLHNVDRHLGIVRGRLAYVVGLLNEMHFRLLQGWVLMDVNW